MLDESKKDDKDVDAHKGVLQADVLQADDRRDVLQRKLRLAAKVVDPQTVTSALTAVSTGSLAVLAVLKVQFARSLSLASSLARTVEKPALRYLTPLLRDGLDEDYHK